MPTRSGKMRRVPRLTSPADMPPGMGEVAAVMGNRARTEILRLASQRPMTAPELADTVGLSGVSAWRHLGALEELGLVDADVPQGQRKGVTVRWSTNCDRVRALGGRWAAYATGE